MELCGQCSAYGICAGHVVTRRLDELRSLFRPFGEENKSYSAAVNPTTIPRSPSPLPSHYVYPDCTNVIHTEQSWLYFPGFVNWEKSLSSPLISRPFSQTELQSFWTNRKHYYLKLSFYWFFCSFSTVWCGRLLKLCFLSFWNYISVIMQGQVWLPW